MNEEFDPSNVVTQDFRNDARVHFWACFAARGPGDIYFYEEPLTAEKMKKIYKECLQASGRHAAVWQGCRLVAAG